MENRLSLIIIFSFFITFNSSAYQDKTYFTANYNPDGTITIKAVGSHNTGGQKTWLEEVVDKDGNKTGQIKVRHSQAKGMVTMAFEPFSTSITISPKIIIHELFNKEKILKVRKGPNLKDHKPEL